MFPMPNRRRPIVLNLRGEPAAVRHVEMEPPPAQPVAAIVIPTDLMVVAFRQLFPAERMVVFGGRRTDDRIVLTSFVDVTERRPSAAHVRACPQKLGQALMDFEKCGAHLALWLHSHPGFGALATYPSDIDRTQEQKLRAHYAEHLLCGIVVADGHLRFWRHATGHQPELSWEGSGVKSCPHHHDVYKLVVSHHC